MKQIAIFALVLGTAIPCVSAAEFVVPVNTARKTTYRMSLNEDCSSIGDVVARITANPSHGTVVVKKGVDNPFFTRDNPRYSCNTRKVASVQVWYTPQRDYLGSDSVGIDYLTPSGNSIPVTVSIIVR